MDHESIVRSISPGLKGLRTLYELKLSQSEVNPRGLARLLEAVRELRGLLRVLSMAGMRSSLLEDPGHSRGLARLVRDMSRLERLDLSANVLDEGIHSLAPAICSLQRLQALQLSRCRLGPGGLRALSVYIRGLPHLKELYLSENAMGEEGLVYLCEGMNDAKKGTQFTSKLECLDLSWNHLGNTTWKS